ncbi:MAG: prephenate dehydrogenase/arogenate dehydrogenase family protein [Oscillospiraceae bacterium]|jgi:prephenate dehydrogenase|nr:prephenate dehydrogenase/arogenate dehydrogenase family protein [Oscillospiraceae bacterium]
MNVGIIGLGLIGGSLAKSIREHTAHTVWGYDIDPTVITRALMCAAIDEPLEEDMLGQCDIVLVALYPEDCVKAIRERANLFAPHALVIDCAGVKRGVSEAIFAIAKDCPWTYIGGHPMAGREFSGFGYAIATLFEQASMILTPPANIAVEVLEFAKAFFLEIGFRSVRITTPSEHDSMIAYTSQLAHIVSGAYVKNPLSQQHKGFSAGSFQDMTRVARLNENMWTELFLANADLLAPSIDDLILRLTQYREALDARDAIGLKALLREGREMKEALDP